MQNIPAFGHYCCPPEVDSVEVVPVDVESVDVDVLVSVEVESVDVESVDVDVPVDDVVLPSKSSEVMTCEPDSVDSEESVEDEESVDVEVEEDVFAA